MFCSNTLFSNKEKHKEVHYLVNFTTFVWEPPYGVEIGNGYVLKKCWNQKNIWGWSYI